MTFMRTTVRECRKTVFTCQIRKLCVSFGIYINCWTWNHQPRSQRWWKGVGAKAFTRLVQQHLRGSTLIAIKEVFKKVGIRFTRTAFEKAIPFGVGVVIGAGTGKALTWFVGNKARDFFRIQ